MGTRRRARRLAITVLYQADVLDELIASRRASVLAYEELSDEQLAFVRRLVDLYDYHRAAVDRALRESGSNWELERMSATDRAVLRIAVTELLLVPEVPPPVSLDEAIEIAREYGGEESGRFVNGVLDAVLRRMQSLAEEELADEEPAEEELADEEPAEEEPADEEPAEEELAEELPAEEEPADEVPAAGAPFAEARAEKVLAAEEEAEPVDDQAPTDPARGE